MTRTVEVEAHRGAYLEALLARDVGAARAVIEASLGAGLEAPDIYLGILQPALYEIGRWWAVGDFSVADEHSATAVTIHFFESMHLLLFFFLLFTPLIFCPFSVWL